MVLPFMFVSIGNHRVRKVSGLEKVEKVEGQVLKNNICGGVWSSLSFASTLSSHWCKSFTFLYSRGESFIRF